MTISSLSNRTVKLIRSLRSRRGREQTGLFFVEGIRLIAEAIQLGAGIDLLVVAPQLLTSRFAQDLVAERLRQGAPCLEVNAPVFKSISSKDGPQGIGAVVHQRWESLKQVHSNGELCWIALDAVQDPGNLGAILRTSEAVGGAGVILLGNTTDPYDPSAVRASMGAVFSQQLVRAGWGEFSSWEGRHACFLAGTSDASAVDYQAVHYESPLILLMGSEREGLSAERQALCDVVVSIPMAGRSDSLNLAVATGVMLYEIFNQRRRQ